MRLSIIVPTHNEEADLPRLLRSVKSLAGEILVVDSGSTDQTLNLARESGARILHHPFTSFADTRNFADKHARYDWILSLDADNELTPAFIAEILTLPDTPAVYKIPRLNLIWGKMVSHADWGPLDDCHIRLYHRSLGRWGSAVHEQFLTSATAHSLHHPLLHHNYQTVDEYITKLNFYSDLAPAFPSWQFLLDFGKRYFYKLGFLEGYHGFFLSYLQALYYLTVNIKHRR